MIFKGIKFDETLLAQVCRLHGFSRLSLFGSILTEKFGPDSDVDLLVEFKKDRRVSLFDIGGMTAHLGNREAPVRVTPEARALLPNIPWRQTPLCETDWSMFSLM